MESLLIALSILIQNAQARDPYQTRATIESVGAPEKKKSSEILSYIPGSIENMRQPIINDLISSEIPELESPPNPRIWTEHTKSDIVVSNTKLGSKVPILELGGKLSLEFKYALKTSFVMISSKRKAEKIRQRKKNAKQEEATVSEEVLNFDETTFQTYPNVRPGYPMVGFCVFEASLAIERAREGGFNFVVEESAKKGTVETMSNAIFSNFFQLKGDVPVNDYLEKVCNGIFKTEVEPMVVSDFSKLVMEKIVGQNPTSNCTPSNSPEDIETGDASCLDWHNKNYSQTIRHLTVPRCTLQQNGTHRCRLKAREGAACRVYVDPRTKIFSTTFTSFDHTILATENHFAYSCDQKAGLSCVMEKDPVLLHGVPLISGRARCKADQN